MSEGNSSTKVLLKWLIIVIILGTIGFTIFHIVSFSKKDIDVETLVSEQMTSDDFKGDDLKEILALIKDRRISDAIVKIKNFKTYDKNIKEYLTYFMYSTKEYYDDSIKELKKQKDEDKIENDEYKRKKNELWKIHKKWKKKFPDYAFSKIKEISKHFKSSFWESNSDKAYLYTEIIPFYVLAKYKHYYLSPEKKIELCDEFLAHITYKFKTLTKTGSIVACLKFKSMYDKNKNGEALQEIMDQIKSFSTRYNDLLENKTANEHCNSQIDYINNLNTHCKSLKKAGFLKKTFSPFSPFSNKIPGLE